RQHALQRQVDPRLPLRVDASAPRHPAARALLPRRASAARRDGESDLSAGRHPTGVGRHARRQAQPRSTGDLMEFGIFAQLFVPRFERDADPNAEHKRIMRNVEISLAAERAGLKYVWCPEHHFLDEYSHMPGPEVFLSY